MVILASFPGVYLHFEWYANVQSCSLVNTLPCPVMRLEWVVVPKPYHIVSPAISKHVVDLWLRPLPEFLGHNPFVCCHQGNHRHVCCKITKNNVHTNKSRIQMVGYNGWCTPFSFNILWCTMSVCFPMNTGCLIYITHLDRRLCNDMISLNVWYLQLDWTAIYIRPGIHLYG